MERTERRVHPVLTALVSLSVAGTCLAVPGIALADKAAPADDDAVEAAADEAADGAQILSFGGVRVDIPLDMEVVELPENNADDMQMANLPGGTLSVAVTASDDDEAMPADADPEEFFAEVADGLAAELDAEISTSGTLDLADGATAYTYEIDEPAEKEGGLAGRIVFAFVPTGDGAYATIQISCFDTDVEAHADAIDDMLASIALSEDDPAASAAPADLPQQAEAGGIALNLPEDVAEVEDKDGARWENADGSLIVRVVPDALPGEEATTDAIEADVELLASAVEGTVGAGSVLWNDDVTTVQTYTVEFELDGTAYVTTYGYVVLEDGTATVVICDCTADDYDARYAALLDSIYGSIELA